MQMTNVEDLPCDRFGNRIDPTLRYARGTILSDDLAEARRQEHAFSLVRQCFVAKGDDGLFNLTGLIRAFPFEADDAPSMQSYVHFIARSQRELESAALPILGADSSHDGFLTTRVSAAMLAIMLTLLAPGDHVVSLVPADRSHPSIRSAVDLARGAFHEATEIGAFRDALAAFAPRLAVISAIAPSKHHLPFDVTQAAIAAAREAGCIVLMDDAHMAARLAIYDEPPALALGADVAVWSLDKHLGGPRSGFVAGRRDLVARIRARALALGIEAQLGQYIAGLNAVRQWNPQPIRAAAALANEALAELNTTLPQVYGAGAGVALSGEDLLELALARAGRNETSIAPIEAVAYSAIALLQRHGAVTIPAVGMPGAACTLRLMLYPDGHRYGLPAVVDSVHEAIETVAEAVREPALLAPGLLGAAA